MNEDALDLCSREPIHIPGFIQSHGYLVILNPELNIIYCSDNLYQLHDHLPQELCGMPVLSINILFDKGENDNFIHDFIKLSWQGRYFKPLNPYVVMIEGQNYNMVISLSGENYILDFEPELSDLYSDPQNLIGASLSQMLADKNINAILANTVTQIKNIIGYDRIMIYKFHEDGHGEVVAEEKEEMFDTWLGLHYPASDIPKQARELYIKNLIRLIADVNQTPISISGIENIPADLTNSTLRAVSPVHIRYLKNMGVSSSFSVSIVVDDQLWGLIACHNYTPRFINYRQRETAKLIGQVLSSCVGLRSQEKIQKESMELQVAVMEVTRNLLSSSKIESFIEDSADVILPCYKASGIAFIFEGKVYASGNVPDDDRIMKIGAFLENSQQDVIVSTDCKSDFPNIDMCSSNFAGLLACRLTADLKDCLILFRTEISLTVRWAGDPAKIVHYDKTGQPFISPRNSFEQWSQEVQGRAEDWSENEKRTLLEIRDEINFAIGRKISELRILNEKLRDAYAELDTFAYTVSHDLKTPLTAIKAFAELIGRKTSEMDILRMSDKIVDNSDRLHQMITTVLEYSKVGQQYIKKQTIDMTLLIDEIKGQLIINPINEKLQLNVFSTPDIEGDPVLIFQVFLNVIENAVKYSHLTEAPKVSVKGYAQNNEIVYEITDNGIGMNEEQQSKIFGLFSRANNVSEFEGSGVGLATVKKIMNRHDATINVKSVERQGSNFILKFPFE
ncbi:ATP-binding protein [Chryseobacterium fluminis]|uniref:ATP-binding protein n=1 Tax=Chryseobacterium fluminis TaxID=2983606 RepID=UPI00224ED533|nr:ATP-binding protein [Chryseobacterium sp. MMS21-Ot14]UZT97925.1 ATP-binding protein [Chryseobacterium sp. MMS21-Ot14]